MAAKIVDPTSLFAFRLNVAMAMEHDSLAMLQELEEAARSEKVKGMFAHHAEETRGQIERLETAFDRLELEVVAAESPTTKGLAEDGRTLVSVTSDDIRDVAVIGAALGTEHYELAAYLALVSGAEAMEEEEVRQLLVENLLQERHTGLELEVVLRTLLGDS
ncbi:ferritin-like domain-containing protein [Arenibacterium sp. S380]|uniref:YciE/YciF ferroxidase family protein n=1 Tax=Arenibacterium sp. S380 TaxID=3415138 RepID=UPI003C7C9F93